METYLGLDAGGTHTRAWHVARDGTLLGRGAAGPGNPNNVGLAAAAREIARAAEQARGPGAPPAAACFVGAAGIKAHGDARRLAAALGGLAVAGGCVVANDVEAALAGGLAGRPGVALVAGTGSFCLGRDGRGQVAHCGGWGWALDDVGSAFFLGREALRAAVLAADGRGRPTQLGPVLWRHFGLDDPNAVLAAVYEQDGVVHPLAGLAPLVLDVAAGGDPVAREIVERGAHGLAELVRVVMARLDWTSPPEVVLVGGVAESASRYPGLIAAALAAVEPRARIARGELPPVAGAALRALAHGGVKITAEIVRNLAAADQEGSSS